MGAVATSKSGRLSLSQGAALVALARKSIAHYLKNCEVPRPKPSSQPRGVFVTLHSSSGKLRGCIGFPFPIKPLEEAVAGAAIAAAVNDPRFDPVGLEELSRLLVEISVLSVPQEISYSSPGDLAKKIEIGKDGLILEYGPYSGLLLPQVPAECKWDAEAFLDNLCLKAGLYAEFWKKQKPGISKFGAQIFSEKTPGGKVCEKKA